MVDIIVQTVSIGNFVLSEQTHIIENSENGEGSDSGISEDNDINLDVKEDDPFEIEKEMYLAVQKIMHKLFNSNA